MSTATTRATPIDSSESGISPALTIESTRSAGCRSSARASERSSSCESPKLYRYDTTSPTPSRGDPLPDPKLVIKHCCPARFPGQHPEKRSGALRRRPIPPPQAGPARASCPAPAILAAGGLKLPSLAGTAGRAHPRPDSPRRCGHRCRRIPVHTVPAALLPDPRPYPARHLLPRLGAHFWPSLRTASGGPRPRRRDRTQKPASAAVPRAATASVAASPLRGSCSS